MKKYVVREKNSNCILIMKAENLNEVRNILKDWAMSHPSENGEYLFEGDTCEKVYINGNLFNTCDCDCDDCDCDDCDDCDCDDCDYDDCQEKLKELYHILKEMGAI